MPESQHQAVPPYRIASPSVTSPIRTIGHTDAFPELLDAISDAELINDNDRNHRFLIPGYPAASTSVKSPTRRVDPDLSVAVHRSSDIRADDFGI